VSLEQLRYFVTVADEGGLRRAAARLHVSQPPLTRQIRALEDELGVELFQRSARGVRLRPQGEVFLRHAREILLQLDRAVEATRSSLEPPSG